MISTHILDTSLGHPAAGVTVELDRWDGSTWARIASSQTDSDGRIVFDCPRQAATYRLQFRLEPYFKSTGRSAFFVKAPVVFQITDTGRKYHIPLLLNPYGYSTYRGS